MQPSLCNDFIGIVYCVFFILFYSTNFVNFHDTNWAFGCLQYSEPIHQGHWLFLCDQQTRFIWYSWSYLPHRINLPDTYRTHQQLDWQELIFKVTGSISYLHILSSYFRRCVVCKDFFKIEKVLANSLNLWLSFCLVLTWDPIWINSIGNHGVVGVSSERRHSSCSSFFYFRSTNWSFGCLQYSEPIHQGYWQFLCDQQTRFIWYSWSYLPHRINLPDTYRTHQQLDWQELIFKVTGSISYLHILSSYFRRCVVCKDFFKIEKVLANSLNLLLSFCLVLTWDPIWINSIGNHGVVGVSSERRHSSCSNFFYFRSTNWSFGCLQYSESLHEGHWLFLCDQQTRFIWYSWSYLPHKINLPPTHRTHQQLDWQEWILKAKYNWVLELDFWPSPLNILTHLPLVPHICVSESGQHWFR